METTREDLLTVADAAKLLGLSESSIRLIERLGGLPCQRTISGTRLFRRADVEQYAAERRSRGRRP
jgi:excisionase family DNA binding protein